MENIKNINQALASSVDCVYDDDTFSFSYSNNIMAAAGAIAMTKFLFDGIKNVGKSQKEYKYYLGAKVREKRYKKRYASYKNILNIVQSNSNVFTSSYNVFLYTSMEHSSNLLFLAIDDISIYENRD